MADLATIQAKTAAELLECRVPLRRGRRSSPIADTVAVRPAALQCTANPGYTPKLPTMDKPVLAEIFSQGDEVVTGQIADTNAAWLAEQLQRLGFEVSRHTTVGDRLNRLAEVLGEIAQRADCCLCTGGLGPTVDDLTAEAVALAFDRPLELDRQALAQIEQYFAHRGYPMPAINRKQAMLPRNTQRLDNRCGTAPGFAMRHGRCYFAFLPGVPIEMKAMFTHEVAPQLGEHFVLRPARLITFRTVGLGESSLQQKLQTLLLPDPVRLGFRAAVPENEVKLLFPPGFPDLEAEALVNRLLELLGDTVFSVDGTGMPGGNLATAVGRLLLAKDANLATAETASVGQLAWQCRGHSWLLQSLAAGNPRHLWTLLNGESRAFPSDPDCTARMLATRLRESSGATYALINLGEVPSQETTVSFDPPASNIVLALAGPIAVFSRQIRVAGAAERRRHQVAALSLDLLRHTLMSSKSAETTPNSVSQTRIPGS